MDNLADMAKIAYEAYGMQRAWVTFDGRAMENWVGLPAGIKEAWKASATAVVAATLKGTTDPSFSREPESKERATITSLGRALTERGLKILLFETAAENQGTDYAARLLEAGKALSDEIA